MIPLDYLLAVAILSAPGDVADPERFATVRPTLQAVAIEWELIDPRERPYLLANPADFAIDLKMLRRRCEDLTDAPPLADHWRFPDRALVQDLLSANRAYRQYLECRQKMEPDNAWNLRDQAFDVDLLYAIWDLVRDARCDYFYCTVRRAALNKLRETIGFEAYNAGVLPPHVPIWRFREIR